MADGNVAKSRLSAKASGDTKAKTSGKASVKRSKPAKPYKDFPLTPRKYLADGTVQWCKKIRGQMRYFTGTPDEALRAYNAVKDDLLEGRDPRAEKPGESVAWLCGVFMDSRQALVDSGELTERSKDDYHRTCTALLRHFGKGRRLDTFGPQDFAGYRKVLVGQWNSPNTIGNEMGRINVVLKYAYDIEAVDRPIRTGPDWKRPSLKAKRLHKRSKAKKLFTAEQIHALLDVADVHVAAMVMLGINCAYNNADCGLLELSWVDFGNQWLAEMRNKTAVDRQAWLWPESIDALKVSLAARKEPKSEEHAERFFITKYGGTWFKDSNDNPLSQRVRKYLDKIGMHDAGVNFSALRSTFQTVAGNSKDQVAVNVVFGHEGDRMASVYRQDIDPQRVIDVCSFVRDWFLEGANDKPGAIK